MPEYSKMSVPELQLEFRRVKEMYENFKARGLNLDMSRGKPGVDQMDLSYNLFHQISDEAGYKSQTGIDCRNYGGLDGLSELKSLFGQILEMPAEQVIVAGNSSLNLMFDTISQAMTHGMPGGKPWMLQGKIKFICPTPGYDRHFSICQYFGIEMIAVENTDTGPDMDEIESLVSSDASIKGIWCVPKFSNPEGVTYSDETVRRIAALKPAAPDFRVMWDNAYVVHSLSPDTKPLLNIYKECVNAGNPNLVIMFTSTSKITFPGAGVAAEAASPTNVAHFIKRMSFQTIGPDKLNQLRHARMFKSINDIESHMKSHSEILRPKFNTVINELNSQLGGRGIAKWTNPEGGYFINLNVMDGCAKRVVALCKEAGVIYTPAGATYPYGFDSRDRNVRIAPTFPIIKELEIASELLCIAVRFATLEKLLCKLN